MAQSINEVLGREIKSVKELRAAIKEYQDALIGVDAESEEFKTTTEQLRAAQDELNKVTKAGKDAYDAATDSIVGMEREYKGLYNQYKLLSEEQRNSDFGKNMAASLNELSTKLNETKQGVGNFKDNIGRYTQSVMDAFKQMGGSVGGLVGPFATATKGVDAFNKTLKANPVMAVVSLLITLVNVIKQLAGSIKDNEESQMRLNQAMASFQPIIDAAKNAMDKFGQVIVSVVEFVAKAVDKIREAKAAFTDFLGITKGAKDAVKEQQETYKALAQSVNDLTKAKREYQKANAADKAEVERLREEASEATNTAEKRQLLQEAKEKQAEIDARNIEIAKQELAILETQASLTANDAAMNDKLAAAVAKVSEAEAAAAANARSFNKQLGATTSAAGGAVSAMKNYREEARKIYERTVEDSKSEVQKLSEKYEKEKKLLEKYGLDTTKLTKQFEKQVNDIFVKASETAAEKASKAYLDNAKAIIASQGNFIDELVGDDMAVAVSEVEKLTKKLEFFKERMTGFLSLNTEMQDYEEQAKQFVSEMSEILGVEIPFPKMDEEGRREFIQKLTEAADKTEEKVKEMEASLDVKRLEKELNDYYEAWTKGNIDLMKSMGQDMANPEGYEAAMAQRNREYLDAEQAKLEQMLAIENLGVDERLAIEERYFAVLEEKRQQDLQYAETYKERTNAIWENAFGAFDSVSKSIDTVINSYSQLMQAEIKSGKLTDKEAKKKKKTLENLAKVQLALNIAAIASDTASGIMSIWAGYAQETKNNAVAAAASTVAAPAVLAALNTKSLISAILKTTGLGANAAAQLAAARGGYVSTVNNLRDDGGASTVASVSTPTEVETEPFTYSRTVQTFEEEDRLNQPIFVSVTDINNVQNRVKVVEEESSF